MALHITAETPRQVVPIPDHIAHDANLAAVSAKDGTDSREAFERDVREELAHPFHAKVVAALQSRQLVLYALLTVCLVPALGLEYWVSRDLYEVLLSVNPLVPFAVAVSLAILASALLAEGIPAVSLGIASPRAAGPDKPTGVIGDMYGRRERKIRFGGPIPWVGAGFAVAAGVAVAIYCLSAMRVELMVTAGEIPGALAQIQIWLPVVLFCIGIALGIPACFVALAAFHSLRLRRLRAGVTTWRDREITLQQSAVHGYGTYLSALDSYNVSARQQGMGERLLVPPCTELRTLLIANYTYDPTRPDATPSIDSPRAANPTPRASDAAPTTDPRVDDLLNLVDEQISRSNRAI